MCPYNDIIIAIAIDITGAVNLSSRTMPLSCRSPPSSQALNSNHWQRHKRQMQPPPSQYHLGCKEWGADDDIAKAIAVDIAGPTH